MSEDVHQQRLVRAICSATDEVFQTMLGLKAEAGEPFTNRNAPGPSNGVVSLIGMAGNWVGTGSVSCSAELACRMSSLLLMAEYSSVNEDVLDAVAEVTNMVIGNVKTILEEELGPLGMSIPTVVFGRNFSTRAIGRTEWTVVPFQVEGERLEVQVCLAPHREAGSQARSSFAPAEVIYK
jgi:chemotaxis protein CheX